jgi:acyl transferase domain-containing protein
MDSLPRVAIVGVSGIFSGAATLEQFWSNILHARDTSRDVPPGRWLLSPEDAYTPGIAVPDRLYSTRGYFLDELSLDLDGLDLDLDLARQLDPLFHLVLIAGRQAWHDARTESLDRRRVGVLFGNIVLPTEKTTALTEEILGTTIQELVTGRPVASSRPRTHPLNRHAAGLPAALLARALGLGAGSATLDAACASSLFALKLAADKLQSFEAAAMLAGGACRPDSLYTQMGFSQLRALSPSGRCRPLDAQGDGLVVGEGAGFFVLKRLEDALAQGDRIYAVIAGIGLSNDIKGNLLAPESEGQLRALQAAYQQAGWQPEDVDLIECHATGTPVGDAVELASLHRLWGARRPQRPCVLGSVKSNIGHTLTAAGSAALLKVLLALQHRILPPTANFERPRTDTFPKDSPFRVLRAPSPWEPRTPSTPRRAAVSGFGFGGTNAHVLLEEWREEDCRLPIADCRLAGGGFGKSAIAIVGLDAHFGPWRGLAAFQERIFGNPLADTPPASTAGRWWGAEESAWFREQGLDAADFQGWFIDQLTIGLDEFRIAPRDLEEMLPQQVLMLQVAAHALADAQLSDFDPLRLGVLVGLALDLNTTNFHLRWSLLPQTRLWNEQLNLDLSPEELTDWTAQLRQAAGPALTAGRVLGALGSITASRIARAFGAGGPSCTVASEETSGLSALELAVRLLRRGELDYALVGAVDLPGDVRGALSGAASPRAANPYTDEDTMPVPRVPIGEGAAAIVLRRLEDAERAGDRIYAILRNIGCAPQDNARPATDPAPLLGDIGAAASLAALVAAALWLYCRLLPARAGERATQYWLEDRHLGPRRLTVTYANVGGEMCAALLEEAGRSNAGD